MKWFKRVTLFLAVNFLVLVTINVFLNVILPLFGINLNPASTVGLMAFCAAWGFGGAFISLFLSKFMAKRAMGVQILDPQKAHGRERWIVETVHRLAKKAGLERMPEVGVYEAPDINAFATGPSRNNSLVAVSTGLLGSMNEAEVEGVIGHEIAHIANGDMVTMTLIQGVVNAFVMFFARIIARAVASSVDEKYAMAVHFGLTFLLEILFSLLGAIVVAYFSRIREYRADRGGAELAGRDKMIAGLRKLQLTFDRLEPDNGSMATLKISSKPTGMMALFMSHPPLDDRIRRLQLGV